jgi:hypothetical protein
MELSLNYVRSIDQWQVFVNGEIVYFGAWDMVVNWVNGYLG